MMHVKGSHRAGVAPAVLWDALRDPERLGEALPQAGPVEVMSADAFAATVRPATGLGVTPIRLDVRIAEREELRRVRIVGDGTGGEYRVAFDVTLVLDPEDDGTRVSWEAGVQAFGVLASLTQRVLPMLLRDQIIDVLSAAEAQTKEAIA
jgi:carbon monoxide dehydrogenase subunit G